MSKRSCPDHSEKGTPPRMRVGAGLGIGLAGALLLALRFGRKKFSQSQIPDTISPAVFATRVLNTSFGEIVYHFSGTGEPILFLHGVFPGASSFEWSQVYPHFASTHRVLVPDLIGFGESQRPNPTITAEAHVRSLAQFLENTVGEQRTTIIASGLSANLALLLNNYYPNKIAKLLLWMPLLAFKGTPHFTRYHRLNWLPALARIVYRRQLSTELFIRQWLLRSGFPADNLNFQEVLNVLTSTAQQYGAEHAFLAQNARAFWQKAIAQLKTTSTPITLFTCKDFEYLTDQTMTRLRSLTHRLAVNEIEAPGSLSPLINPIALTHAIVQELS